MALASRFATAKFLGTAAPKPRTAFVGGKTPTAGAGLLAQALGPQSVAVPTGAPPPAAAPAPVASVLPPDASYEQSVALLGKQHDIDLAKFAQAKQQALSQYGYTQDAGGALAFDPSNPFSQAAMLKRKYDQAQAGNTNSYAARGQLYSGAAQNAQNQTAFQNQAGNNSLQNALLQFLANNTGGIAQANLNYESGLGTAKGNAVANAQNNALYQAQLQAANTPAPVDPGTTVQIAPLQDTNAAPAAYKTVPGKDSKGNPGVWHIYANHRVFVRS